MATAYNDLKFTAFPERLEAIRSGEPTTPGHVHFIMSDLCNHDCGFCAYRMNGYTSNLLSITAGTVTTGKPRDGVCYVPVKLPTRRSATARMPSWWSLVDCSLNC